MIPYWMQFFSIAAKLVCIATASLTNRQNTRKKTQAHHRCNSLWDPCNFSRGDAVQPLGCEHQPSAPPGTCTPSLHCWTSLRCYSWTEPWGRGGGLEASQAALPSLAEKSCQSRRDWCVGKGRQGQPPEPLGERGQAEGSALRGQAQQDQHRACSRPGQGYISSDLSTDLDQALVQCRLATSERKCAKAALHSQSSQLKKKKREKKLHMKLKTDQAPKKPHTCYFLPRAAVVF